MYINQFKNQDIIIHSTMKIKQHKYNKILKPSVMLNLLKNQASFSYMYMKQGRFRSFWRHFMQYIAYY